MATAPAARRIGAPDSKTRAQLMDAAELVLREEGYAAVTSRRVAARAGLKPQLVHYYFRTMDDLFLEVFRRRAEENLARFERGDRGGQLVARRSGSSTPTRAAPRSRWSSSRWRTIARPSAPRSPASPNGSAPPRSRRCAPRSPDHGISEDQLPPLVATAPDDRASRRCSRSKAGWASPPVTTDARVHRAHHRGSRTRAGRVGHAPLSRARAPGGAARASRCR